MPLVPSQPPPHLPSPRGRKTNVLFAPRKEEDLWTEEGGVSLVGVKIQGWTTGDLSTAHHQMVVTTPLLNANKRDCGGALTSPPEFSGGCQRPLNGGVLSFLK